MPNIFNQTNYPAMVVVSPAGVQGPVGPEYTLTQQKLNDTIELNPAATRDSLELGSIATRDSNEFQPAGNYVLTTDARLSDNRDPNPHTHSWSDIEEPIQIIEFDTNSGGPITTGQLGWNNNVESLVVKGSNNVDLEISEKLVYHVQNNSGTTISKGSPVAYAGTTGNSGKELVKLWDGATDSVQLFMGLAASDIPNGATGYVVHFGKLRGVNTNSFASGAILYANPTGTGLTSVKPTVDHVVVAACINSANNGTLSVRPNIELVTHWDDVLDKPSISEIATPNTIAKRDDIGGLSALYFQAESSAGFTVVTPGAVDVYEYGVTTRQGSLRAQPEGSPQFVAARIPRVSGTLLVGSSAAQTFLSTPTSANFSQLISDETGTGSLVFSNSPTLVNPALGTPVSGSLVNCNNLPISGVTGLTEELNNKQPIGSYVLTNDSRLTDARTPLAHAHGNITNDGRVGTVADRVVTTTTGGAVTTQQRSGIDSRTSFPNSDVTSASEFTGANTLVRRSSTGSASFTAVNVAQTNGLVFFGVNPVTITVNATSARLLTLPDTTGTLAVATTNAQTFLSTPSSANLAVALGDASGTDGGFVRATGATLTTPLINNPTVQGYVENTNTVAASGAAQTISIANSTFQAFTLTANCTFTLPPAVNGQSFTLIVYSNTGAFTTSFVAPAGSSISWANQIVPVGTNIANRADLYSFVAHGTRWFASQSPNHSA